MKRKIIKKLYDPFLKGEMRVAGFTSGFGSNLRKIIEHEREGGSNYRVVVIFTDNCKSNAVDIGRYFNLPVIVCDIKSFYKVRRESRKNLRVRVEFDKKIVKSLVPYSVFTIAYAGYMSIVTKILIKSFLGINIHPADLSIMENAKRKYKGKDAVGRVIFSGENEIRSTTHIVEEKVDAGKILMISSAVEIFSKFEDPCGVQELLKKVGDWVIFPLTLQHVAQGRYAKDVLGNLYFDGKAIPEGVKLN